MQNTKHQSSYRWVIIALCAFTAICVIAGPTTSLSVLFDEIASELGLTLVQVGFIWGTASFTGMMIGLLGGILGDRFGAKRVIITACIGVGLVGATRGLATGFVSFIGSSFFMGLFMPLIAVNLHSVAGHWFNKQELGVANGIISAGFATGFLTGAILAANVLSPALGGWRPIFYMYGGIALLLALLWWLLHPDISAEESQSTTRLSLHESLPQVLRLRTIWLIGIGKLGVWGGVRGVTGYLPLYLRDIGWEPSMADAALSTFFIVSLLGAIPIPIWSDRLGVRKPFLLVAVALIGSGSILIGAVDGWVVFVAAAIAGIMFDAFMGLSITLTSEAKSLNPALTGTALGFTFLLGDVGGTIAPPLGNALASISPEFPFYLWGGMALIASLSFAAVRE